MSAASGRTPRRLNILLPIIWNLEKSYIPGIFPEYSQVKHMSDIFLDIPGICRPCIYASNISGICLTYTFRVIWRLSLEYSRHILSESFENMLGIFLAYSSASESACSSNAFGMQLRTYFGRQGNLMIGAIRGRHTGQRHSCSRCSTMWHSIDCDCHCGCSDSDGQENIMITMMYT